VFSKGRRQLFERRRRIAAFLHDIDQLDFTVCLSVVKTKTLGFVYLDR